MNDLDLIDWIFALSERNCEFVTLVRVGQNLVLVSDDGDEFKLEPVELQ